MAQDDRATAGLSALVDSPESRDDTWYLVLSRLAGETSSRVVVVPEGGELLFGRASSAALCIDHDAVSRRHALVRRRQETITIEDLGSRNGTLVNGIQIAGSRRLAPGDEITIGPASAVLATTTAIRRRLAIGSFTELEDRLAAEVDRALRYHRSLGLAMLRLDGPMEELSSYIDAIAADLRRMDFVGEYGPSEFAVVLPEADGKALELVAQRLRKVKARMGVDVQIGTAVFPTDGTRSGELINAARASLRGVRGGKKGERETAGKVALAGKQVIIGDPVMKQVYTLARQCAASSITVLVVGETGVGKEVVAEAVHRFSPRAEKAYVRLNCASLPESLLEAELFGYERGAFTGANRLKAGYFEAASGGTLFLDEIGELPESAQAKLLRALEQRRITRVGGTKEIAVDVRLVCATNRDLEAEMRRGRFREDLYFRISAFVIPVPPLRDRKAEIEPLAQQFCRELAVDSGQRVATITAPAMVAMLQHDWPGNVRELRNAIERAVVLSGGGSIEVEHLPDRLREGAITPRSGGDAVDHDVRRKVAEVERDSVQAALDESAGNQTHAARRLGISRFALIRLMEKHGMKSAKRAR
jgi:DNA-binding NtrC family response regulator/pSer/pThr/pTyr-binding forkhead associated (FHA) protein